MKKAIIIGATSGIGEALARELIAREYAVGLTGRRFERLQALHGEFGERARVAVMDVAKPEEAVERLHDLIQELGGVDLVVVNAGYGVPNREHEWAIDRQTIEVNVLGFAAMCAAAMRYFIERGGGHIVGISSIAAHRGQSGCSAYPASKAFASNFLEGLRLSAFKRKLPITVTDIQPGFVDTPMTEEQPGMFWVAPVDKAARQIFTAIEKKRKHAYVTRRWRLVAWLMKYLPDFLYRRIG